MKYKHERAQKVHHVNNKRNNSRKLKSFDEKNRNRIKEKKKRKRPHAHTINRLVIISCLYTKLREEKKPKER